MGETPLPSAPRSVFEYMSQKDRERLKNITSGASSAAPGPAAGPAAPAPSAATITVPRTEPHIAQAALRGFQPFTTDPVKQSRYTAYLQSQASLDPNAFTLKLTPGQKVEEFNKELADYAKAALIFKPISGAMAGRFTSAAVIEHGPKIHEGLHTPTEDELNKAEKRELEAREEEKVSPKAHAARMGMYGPLTREEKPWQPAKLLCKRFGVKDPNPEPVVDIPSASGSGWQQPGTTMPEQSTAMAASGGSDENHSFDAASGSKSGRRRDLSNIGLGEDDGQGQDTLTYERPAMDIFKAIFASDDEDSGDDAQDDNDDDDPEPSTPAPQLSVSGTAPLINTASGHVNVGLVPTATAYDPVSTSDSIPAEKINIGSFKPTFIPRSERDGKPKQEKGKDRKDRKKNAAKNKSLLVSFELDEDGGELLSVPRQKPKEKSKKKKKRKEKEVVDDDEAMWVEKPPPEVVKELAVERPPEPSHTSANSDSKDVVAGPPKGRKRAIDFM